MVSPTSNAVKINVDAAFDANLMKGAIAVIVRDEAGDFLTGSACPIICSSPIAAEALAVREAISIAGAFDSYDVFIESDYANVTRSCDNSSPPWQIKAFMDDIRNTLSENARIRVNWVRRYANTVVDLVAKMMMKGTLPRFWTWMMPVKIRATLLEDKRV